MIDKTNFTKGSQATFFAGTLEEASETIDSAVESQEENEKAKRMTFVRFKF